MSNQKSKLGIIAGGGELPFRLASSATNEGREVVVVGIKGFAEQKLLEQFDSSVCSIGEVGKVLRILTSANVADVCFAGIVRRPDFKSLKVDRKGLMLLPRVVQAASKGDDALLSVLVKVMEEAGLNVVGADDVLGSLLAPQGNLTESGPSSETEWKDLKKAAEVAAEIGRLDIGQGAVVCRGLVLSVEAQEGTDLMLMRCAELSPELRGTPSSKSGVLVKRPKPNQERRIDLPTIGVKTVEGAAKAGLVGIGVEAGAALVMDSEAVIQVAKQHDIWIYAFDPSELDKIES